MRGGLPNLHSALASARDKFGRAIPQREVVFKSSLESRRRRALPGRIAAWPAWKVGRYVRGWKFAFLLTALQRSPQQSPSQTNRRCALFADLGRSRFDTDTGPLRCSQVTETNLQLPVCGYCKLEGLFLDQRHAFG
jgi:hypothetical protein